MSTATVPFEVRNRWTGEVQFTAQIACSSDEWPNVKMGLAVRWARKSDAVLRDADLSDADLRDADLRDADLRGAVLRGAVLRSFKADLWLTLASAQAEIPGLITAIREGRINGAVYSGDCACLVGTIANVRGVSVADLDRGAGRPAEQWFAMIKPGDKPGDDTGGGFAAQQALDWTLEFCRTVGIDPENASSPAEAA